MKLSLDIQKKIRKLGQQCPVLSDREISRRLKVSRDAVARYRGPLPLEDEVKESETLISPETHLADAKAIERLRADNSRLRAMNRLLTRSGTTTVESIVDQFRQELKREDMNRFEFEPKVYPEPDFDPVFDEDHEEIVTLMLSDWHLGETIRPEESNGVNKYNSIIAANRLYRIIDKFKRIVRGHQQMYRIKSIWIPVLGDMINGSIHPDLLLTNDLLDVPAAILAARLLIMVIHELKTLGLPIELDCVVGNHPRLVPQMPSKRQAHLSLDWMIYTFVEEKFADDEQVIVRVHTGQFGLVEQYGHRFVLEHGYGAPRDGKLQERIRKMFDNPLYREATGMEGPSVDMVLIGDKHRAEAGPGYMVNGCLPGQGEYGVMLRLDPIGAIQQMFGISQTRPRTFQYELDVTGLVDESIENPMSEYTAQFLLEHGR